MDVRAEAGASGRGYFFLLLQAISHIKSPDLQPHLFAFGGAVVVEVDGGFVVVVLVDVVEVVVGFFTVVDVVVVGFFAVVDALGAGSVSVPVEGGFASEVGSGAEVIVGVGAGAATTGAATDAAGAGGAGSPFDIIANTAPPPSMPTRMKPPMMKSPEFDFCAGIAASAATADIGAPRGEGMPSGAGAPRGATPIGAKGAGAAGRA